MDATRNTIENGLLDEVRVTLQRHDMLRKGERVVVAVSGGADSVCLLDVLHRLAPEYDLDLFVAHFDHGLRKGEDEQETRFVEVLAREMSVPWETGCAENLERREGSLEERAREARYAFLEGVRARQGAGAVAMGHTLDDQAETVIMRLLRGSGATGLSGIPPKREPGIIRPLIRSRRAEIEDYLKSRGLSWRTDSSNLKGLYLRNRIRLELMPLLLQYQPRLVEHLGSLADSLREEDEVLEKKAGEWLGEHGEETDPRRLSVPRGKYLALEPALRRRVTRQAIKKVSGALRRMDRRHVEAVENLARSTRPQAGVDLPKGVVVGKSYEQLVFGMSRQAESAGFRVALPGPGAYEIRDAGVRITLKEEAGGGPVPLRGSSLEAFLDAEEVNFPLEIRSILPGDRFVPLGMKGRRKLKDFLMDLKVPSGERAGVSLLVSGGAIAWVCGFRVDERFKVREGTRKVLHCRIDHLLD